MSNLAKICTALALLNLGGFGFFLATTQPADEYIATKEAELHSGWVMRMSTEPLLIGGRALYVHNGWSPAFAFFFMNLPALIVAGEIAELEVWWRLAPSVPVLRWSSWVLAWTFCAALLLQWFSPLLVRSLFRWSRKLKNLRFFGEST